MTKFNINALRKETVNDNRYARHLAKLVTEKQEIERIKLVIQNTLENIKNEQKSFVIYGEPQSGKTGMMIALTAKLLDENFKIIIVLLNDSVQLLGQNLRRFQRSGLSPSPKKFSEILSPEVKIGEHQWVIFCKKNSKDLQKLIQKLDGRSSRVVIDDEADYATPNSKINKKEKSKINELTGKLIGLEGIYIGVTATPARLDLNRTHQNQNEHWIDFPTHSNYTGQDVFFPVLTQNLPYKLTFLADAGDDPKYLREALFSFIVNVSYLNTSINDPEKNYSILIHTSSKKADHTIDYTQTIKIFEALKDANNLKHESYFKRIWEIASERYPNHSEAITIYAMKNSERNNIVVMNSDKEVNAADNETATDPTAPFTIVIGGNIVSRGVTFNNLLSMFFTRDVKHKLQQDTYIQRARMFGSRNDYLKYFELTIPKSLYLDWQKCFIFHRLSLESRKQNQKTPVWLDGERITAVSAGSIDNTNVMVDKGEMSFDLFELDFPSMNDILNTNISDIQKLKALSELLSENCLPQYLINYIETFCPEGEKSVCLHVPKDISRRKMDDPENIIRAQGFIGDFDTKPGKYPNAIHHIFILYNKFNNKARVFYKYKGNIRFLKVSQKND